jgi:hypothetical protein
MGHQSRLVSPGCATGTEGPNEPGLMPCFPLVANRLDWHPAGVVHFHLKTHFTPIHKMRRDLLEGESNQLARSVPNLQFNYQPSSCTQVAPSHLISQDRAHIVIRLHWKYSKHGRHGNLFIPEWHSTSVLLRFTPSSRRHEAPEDTQLRLHQQTNPPRCFILVEVLNLFTKHF